MFTVEDTSRSLTVALPNKGYAIASQSSGAQWHRTGLSFDDARAHCDRLNRCAEVLPEATAEQIFGLYYASHFLASDIAREGVAALLGDDARHWSGHPMSKVDDHGDGSYTVSL